jgi:VIT1/CCC1 family predicted Fe2+/Mn2+ transporter
LTAPGVDSWYHEKESTWLYRRVAGAERDPHKRRLFEQLAIAAEEQAVHWDLLAALAAMKLRGLSVYSSLPGSIGGHAMPTSLAEVGARHRSNTFVLGAAVPVVPFVARLGATRAIVAAAVLTAAAPGR